MGSRVTQRVEFECCYLLDTELNAHRYRFEVTVENQNPVVDEKYKYIISFEDLESYMKQVVPDKAFIFDTTTYNVGKDIAFTLGSKGVKIVGCPYILTAENLCSHASQDLQRILSEKCPGVTIVSSSLKENTGSFVSWRPNFTTNVN